MNAIKSHGISQKPCAKLLITHEMCMGVASDANVYTFARSAVRTDLPGRPRPHGRRSLQAARAASKTDRHCTSRGGAR